MSKHVFHSGFNVLLMVGVDCFAFPSVTTRYYPHVRETNLIGESLLQDHSFLLCLWLLGCGPKEGRSKHQMWKPDKLRTLKTLTLSIKGFESPTLVCLAGLPLRLCSADTVPPRELKWLLIRWGRPIRTIFTISTEVTTQWTNTTQWNSNKVVQTRTASVE
jgi:hypothetical protein